MGRVVSFRNETVVEPSDEELAALEERAHGYFRDAISGAFEELLEDAKRHKLGAMSLDAVMSIVRRVVTEETAHWPGP